MAAARPVGTVRSRKVDGSTLPRTSAIALCLVGLSPAVVTETLYALAIRRRPRIVPCQLHIITTHAALDRVVSTLLGPRGALQALRDEYRLPAWAFRCPPGHLHVLTAADGQPLDDIVTTRDNEAVGEQIAKLVRCLAEDVTTTLHASLAGGRKTMGALLATALQLHARPGDRLYHVLVSPPYDGVPDFFFPTRSPRRLRCADGVVDARRARIALAEIPIVRLGPAVRELGLTARGLARLASEVEIEAAGRLRLEPLLIDTTHRNVQIGSNRWSPPPQQFALYLLYSRLRQRCRRSRCATGAGCPRCQPTDDEVYDRRAELTAICDAMVRGGRLGGRTRPTGPASEDIQSFRAWLHQTRSRLNALLRSSLGPGPRAAKYLVTEMVTNGISTRRRGLAVPPRLIRLTGRQA